MTTEANQIRRNRILLVGLFAIAIVPLLGAFWLYESVAQLEAVGDDESRRAARSDRYGRASASCPLPTARRRCSTADSGGWSTVSNDGCGADCQDAVHQLRQLHILLGRDASRVKRSLIELGAAPVDASLSQYPEARAVQRRIATLRPGVYIVDPLGNSCCATTMAMRANRFCRI